MMVTFNSTSWATARGMILNLPANVLIAFVQEHHLQASKVDEASATMAACGWGSFWGPAEVLQSGFTSGGVAIFVRLSVGATDPQEIAPEIAARFGHRAVACTVVLPGFGRLQCWSLYLFDGDKMGANNTDLLRAVGLSAWPFQLLMAADWQMDPELLEHSSFLEAVGGKS